MKTLWLGLFGLFCLCAGIFLQRNVGAVTSPTNTLTILVTDARGRQIKTTGTWSQFGWVASTGDWQLVATSDTILCNGFQ